METLMARKNVLTSTVSAFAAANPAAAKDAPNPSTVPGLAFAGRGALGGFTRGAETFGAKTRELEAQNKELEARLTAGQTIVELDPDLIDGSFVVDRMSYDDDAYRLLRHAIEAHGQASPILVRPHPETAGRYQVAFGHRRLKVAKELGRPVRAVVRNLSDRDHVLVQGQENSARADLSFIERARLARKLEQLGYDRRVIMDSLAVDKTSLSTMISLIERIPAEVLEAIGPARAMGRPRWLELAEQFRVHPDPAGLPGLLANESFAGAASDDRFAQVAELFASPAGEEKPVSEKRAGQGTRGDVRYWGPSEAEHLVKATQNTKSYLLSIEQVNAPGFGDFVLSQMEQLYRQYEAGKRDGAER
jgi:ParB family chromosome partitioning protein